ncbi:MAG: metal-sensitive transcriptional regulator [Actinomycetota bacterium]
MTDPHHTSPGYRGDKPRILTRLRRVEGQVRGISRMVEEDRYCIDVLQQISAARAALDKVALALVDDHVRHCVLDGAPERREELTDELVAAIGRLVAARG